MRHRTEGPFLLRLAGHLAMGASLGTGLALALLMMDTGRIFEMIVSSAQPSVTRWVAPPRSASPRSTSTGASSTR